MVTHPPRTHPRLHLRVCVCVFEPQRMIRKRTQKRRTQKKHQRNVSILLLALLGILRLALALLDLAKRGVARGGADIRLLRALLLDNLQRRTHDRTVVGLHRTLLLAGNLGGLVLLEVWKKRAREQRGERRRRLVCGGEKEKGAEKSISRRDGRASLGKTRDRRVCDLPCLRASRRRLRGSRRDDADARARARERQTRRSALGDAARDEMSRACHPSPVPDRMSRKTLKRDVRWLFPSGRAVRRRASRRDATSTSRERAHRTRQSLVVRRVRTFLWALRYCVVHASFAGRRRRLNRRLHLALRNR